MKKILVIDDDKGIQEALRAVLEYGNYEVLIAGDEVEAFKIAEKDHPDLILLDLLLSGQDGKEIAKKLKSHNKTHKIPIIMLSAHPDAIKASAEGGADEFIAKPFEMNDLLEKVNKYLVSE